MFGWLARFKMKIFVKKGGKYWRVTGPTKLVDSVSGLGGYIVVGEEIHIASGLFFSGSNSVSSNSINGVNISEMTLVPATKKEMEAM